MPTDHASWDLPEPERTNDEASDLAHRLADDGDLIGARDALIAGLDGGSAHPGLYEDLGHVYSLMSLWEPAVAAFTEAISRGEPAEVGRGLAFEQLGKSDAAVLDYEAELARDPTSVPALVNLGILELGLGNLDRADRLLRDAVMLDVTANWQLADVSIALGKPDEALDQLNLAIASGEQWAHADRAMLLADSASIADVSADFRAAIDAGRTSAYSEFAIFLDTHGEPEQGLRVALEGVEAGNSFCYATAAIIADGLGQLDEAVRLYRLAVASGDEVYREDLDNLIARDE